jgi:hypothetical protein
MGKKEAMRVGASASNRNGPKLQLAWLLSFLRSESTSGLGRHFFEGKQVENWGSAWLSGSSSASSLRQTNAFAPKTRRHDHRSTRESADQFAVHVDGGKACGVTSEMGDLDRRRRAARDGWSAAA